MQKQIGWTNTQLANVIYCELHEEDDDELMNKFAEKLKKQLKRDTTSPELLQRYIQLISNHHDFRRADFVLANPLRLGAVDQQILLAISTVSKKRLVEEKLNDYD
jgi:3-hydroxyacyl-CoA dehydrogenase